MPTPPKTLNEFSSLLQIVANLRGPNGCPWDKEQTHKSLTRYTIEECYEFVDAVNSKNFDEMKDELGDVLLQVVLHSQIAQENNHFSITDVIENICEKMVRRHPHVFATTKVANTDEVWKNWEEIKKLEKASKPQKEGFDIPKHLNALLKSLKMGEKAKKKNFDWSSAQEVLNKVNEESLEVKEAIANGCHEDIENEVGDLLFSVCQLSRHLKLDPEQTLQKANQRFEKRFFKMNKKIQKQNQSIDDLTAEQLETYWKQAKN